MGPLARVALTLVLDWAITAAVDRWRLPDAVRSLGPLLTGDDAMGLWAELFGAGEGGPLTGESVSDWARRQAEQIAATAPTTPPGEDPVVVLDDRTGLPIGGTKEGLLEWARGATVAGVTTDAALARRTQMGRMVVVALGAVLVAYLLFGRRRVRRR